MKRGQLSSGLRGQASKHLYLMAFVAMLSLSACGKKKTKVAHSPSPTPTKTSKPNQPDNTKNKRLCTIDLTTSLSTESWESVFAELFQWNVSGFENSPTFCGDLAGSGISVNGSIMIEYEDDEGIAFLALDEQHFMYGNLERGKSNKLELIYHFTIQETDTSFLLQVKGQSLGNSQDMEANIRFHRLASIQEQYNEQLAAIQKKCKDGTWTVAQCMGYNFPPTFWWNDPSTYTSANQQKVDLARKLLNDKKRSQELGKIKFKLSDIMN